jgi:hypothetical protein
MSEAVQGKGSKEKVLASSITLDCPRDGDTVNQIFDATGTYNTGYANPYVKCTVTYPDGTKYVQGATPTAKLVWRVTLKQDDGSGLPVDMSGNVLLGAELLDGPGGSSIAPPAGPIHIKVAASGGVIC